MKYLFPPIPDLCHCGCGQIVWNRKQFIHGHNGKNLHCSEERKRKISNANKGKIRTEESKRKNSEAHQGKVLSEEHKRKISKSAIGKNNGKFRSEETRKKLSEANKGINNPNYGKLRSDETKKKISDAQIGKIILEETRRKNSEANKGKIISEKTKKKLRQYIGEKASNWQGGISFEPYCYKFNNSLKQEIRERDNYQCQHPNCLCTQLESIMIYNRILPVHHIHYDKENCYPDLITLCIKHNSGANYNREYHEKLFMKILEKGNLLNWKIKGDK